VITFGQKVKKPTERKRNKMDIETFLQLISEIESSGGKNFNHPAMESGIHKGHQAIGKYGLMPNTVNEIINRMRMSGQADESITGLKNMDPVALKQHLEQNQEIEDKIARALAGKVLQDQGDPEKAAFTWNQGHNLKPERVDEMGYKNNDYVKKFNKFQKLKQSLQPD
jgi:hypothetical protein